MKTVFVFALRAIVGCALVLPNAHGAFTFTAGNQNVTPSGNVSVPITVSGFTDVSAFQFTLTWQASVLALNETTPVTVSSLLSGGVSTPGTPAIGKLTFVWDTGTQATIADNTTVLWVEFSAVGGVGISTQVSFIDDPTTRQVTFSDLTEEIPITINGLVTVVPEPVTYALGLFGAIFVGVAGVRWMSGRRAVSSADLSRVHARIPESAT